MILEPKKIKSVKKKKRKKIKSVTVSIVSPSVCHEMIGLDAMILVFFNVFEF